VVDGVEALEQQLAEQDTQLNHAKQMHEMLEQQLTEHGDGSTTMTAIL